VAGERCGSVEDVAGGEMVPTSRSKPALVHPLDRVEQVVEVHPAEAWPPLLDLLQQFVTVDVRVAGDV